MTEKFKISFVDHFITMVKVCPMCGNANPDDAIYCGKCGYQLTQTPSIVQQPQSLPPSKTSPSPEKIAISSVKKGAHSFAEGLGLFLLWLFLLFVYHYAPVITRLLIIAILALIGSIGLLYEGQKYTRKGFKAFSSLGFRYTEGAVGSVFFFLSFILLLIFSFITILTLLFATVSISVITLLNLSLLLSPILFIIGGILIGIAYLRNGGLYGNGRIKAGGIVIILSIAITIAVIGYDMLGSISIRSAIIANIASFILSIIVAIIGFSIVDSGYGVLLKAPDRLVNQPLPYQQGTIFGDGTAQVSVYSPYQARVIRAEILGTNIATANVIPNMLNVGYNNLRIQFALSQGLIPNTTYTIQLYLDNGQVITTQAMYL